MSKNYHRSRFSSFIFCLALFVITKTNLIDGAKTISLFGVTLSEEQQESYDLVPSLGRRDQQPQVEYDDNYIDTYCHESLLPIRQRKIINQMMQLSEAAKYLHILKCDLKPIYVIFKTLLNHLNETSERGDELVNLKSKQIGFDPTPLDGFEDNDNSLRIWHQYSTFSRQVDLFVDRAIDLLGQKEFCTYSTILAISKLQDIAKNSKLLELAYDLVAIEYHGHCLVSAIERLPPIPYVIKDIVKIYIDGSDDTKMLDLNDPARLQDSGDFDIDGAIAKYGPIENVASLMLTIPLNTDPIQFKELFKSECKKYLINIEERWQTMEMMNKMLATQVNGIESLNNLIMHSITPLKYADICTQLSSKA